MNTPEESANSGDVGARFSEFCALLNDTLAVLVGLSPADTGELECLKTELAEVASEAPPERGQHLMAAIAQIERVLAGEGDDPEGALDAAAVCVERAMTASGSGTGIADEDAELVVFGDESDDEDAEAEQGGDGSQEEALVLPAGIDPSLLAEYVAEGLDLIGEAESCLVNMEAEPDDREHLNTVFRSYHNIKGNSDLLGLVPIRELAHSAGEMFGLIRSGEMAADGSAIDLALRACNALKDMIEGLSELKAGDVAPLPGGFEQLRDELADPSLAQTVGETVQEMDRPIEEGSGEEPKWTPGTSFTVPAETDRGFLREYVEDCREHVSSAENGLLELEADPDAAEEINIVFRAFHTIKGNSALLGLTPIQALSHKAEGMFSQIRSGQIKVTSECVDLALSTCDKLKALIDGLDQGGPGEPMTEPSGLAELWNQLDAPGARDSARDVEVGALDDGEEVVFESDEDEDTVTDEPSPAPETAETDADESTEWAVGDSFLIPADTDPMFLREYIADCADHVQNAESGLLDLEADPDDAELINTVFRAFHTIKGNSALLGFIPVQELAHRAEDMFGRIRSGEIPATGVYADLALKCGDMLKGILGGLEGVQPGDPLPIPEGFEVLHRRLAHPEVVEEDEDAAPLALDESPAEGEGPPAEGDGASVAPVPPEDVNVPAAERPSAAATEPTVRVGTTRLDNLLNMVGELVIAYSMLAQSPEIARDSRRRRSSSDGRFRLGRDTARSPLGRRVGHIGKIVRDLQDLSMSLRMVPLKATFQKMTRLVRDLARRSEKTVNLICEGEDTEIDRNMVEVINDPLVHMIRNAIDHGLESTEDRVAKGKPAAGTLALRAHHSAGNVVIEVRDDGKGLDREKIVAKAVERGLIESGADLSDGEAFALIFQPGFSTADTITDISGRGVGMDVVKKNIEALRGRIDISSELGKGSTFTLRMPLTMAITDAMLVRVAGERYFLPMVSIEHSFRPPPGSIRTVTGRGEMLMLRGDLVPVFRLHELFEVEDAVVDPCEAIMVVVEGEGRRCALMVDALLGQQQVVIKSLGDVFSEIPGIAGAAILGDGRVGLILDAGGLLELAHRAKTPATKPAAV